MDMGVDPACRQDHPLPCQSLRGCANGHALCHAIHDIRISGLSDTCNFSVPDPDIRLEYPRIVDHQRIGDNQIQIAVFMSGSYRLSHAVPYGLAASELHLFPINGIIPFHLCE